MEIEWPAVGTTWDACMYDLDAPAGLFCEPPSPPTSPMHGDRSPLTSTGYGWASPLHCDEMDLVLGDESARAGQDIGLHLDLAPVCLVSPLQDVSTMATVMAPLPLDVCVPVRSTSSSLFECLVARYDKAWDTRQWAGISESRRARVTQFERAILELAADIEFALATHLDATLHEQQFLLLLHACRTNIRD